MFIIVFHCLLKTASSVMQPQMFIRAAILAILVALATSQDCSYDDWEGYIIDIHSSEKHGAVFMSDVNTATRESCQTACCDAEEETRQNESIARCNLAVYHSKSHGRNSKNCFLVFCPRNNSCQLTEVKGFTSSFVTEIKVQETTDPEAFANRPPNPKFYRPYLPSHFHKLFRRSEPEEKTQNDAGAVAEQTKTVLEAAQKLVDVKKKPAVNEDKQVALEEENLLSEIAVGAFKSTDKRAKGSKPHLTTPMSKQPQKPARPITSQVKITTQRPTSKPTSTHILQTEAPTLKTTVLKLTKEMQTKKQTTKPITTPPRPTTPSATSPLLAKSNPSGNKTPPLVLTSIPPGTQEPTSLPEPQDTSQHPVTLPSTKISSLKFSTSKAPPFLTKLATSQSTKPPSGSTEGQSTSSSTKYLATLLPSNPTLALYSVTKELSSTQDDRQTQPDTTTQSIPKSSKTPKDLVSHNQLTKAPTTLSPPTMHDISSHGASSSPAHHAPSSTVLDQSPPTSLATTVLPVTNQSHTVDDASLSIDNGNETTQFSTLLPENDSTLSPSTKESTQSSTLLPENDSTLSPSTKESTPSKITPPFIPASSSIGDQDLSFIIPVNETNISNDTAADVDSEDGQDSYTHSVIASNGALIAAVCFGVLFLLAVMVVLGKRWYEAYQRRHYSKVDFLINGMYN